MVDSIEVQLTEILDDYVDKVGDVVEKSEKKTARDCVQELKNTSPKQTGDYASGWSSKKVGKDMVVYNRKMPGLTHLLENGHVIKNKIGTFGRAPAHPHIGDAAKKASQEFEENIRRGLR